MTTCPFTDAERDEVLEICRRTFQRPRADGSLPRQFHAKTYGCLRAHLTVEPPADPALRHGLFAAPGRYPALLRFSSSFFADDRQPDVRGLSIKLDGVDGAVCDGAPPGQQDFVLMNEPTGPAADAAEAVHLFRAFDGLSKVDARAILAPRYLFPGLSPWRIRWRYLRFLTGAAMRDWRGRDLARMTYFSVTPFRLGDGAVKFRVHPDRLASSRRPARGRDFRERLQAALDAGPIGFEFHLQPRRPDGDPIDDARVAWRGPTVRAGRLEVPPQDVAATVALGDRLAFSPWNCLEAHRPLGSVNALRRPAYAASAANRGGDPRFPASGDGDG